MSKISTWSITAASNNSAAPDGFPEGMAPSGVNNACREVMSSVRTQHEDAQWIDLGLTPTNTSATTFTLVGDQTTDYHVGRRVKCTDATDLYGTITVSVFSAVTTVTVALDSGSLSGSLTAVALGIIGVENTSLPHRFGKGADVASATALTVGADGNYFDITGTTGITSITAIAVGEIIKLHFDDIVTLTHHATDLILPGGIDITTVAGDELEFIEYAAGDWRCTNHVAMYTEGTWTPVLSDTSAPVSKSQTYTVQLGRYTKVRNMVTCYFYLWVTDIGTLSGTARVHGFPFASENTTYLEPGGSVSVAAALNLAVAGTALTLKMVENTQQCLVPTFDSTGGLTNLTCAEWSNGGAIAGTITYFI